MNKRGKHTSDESMYLTESNVSALVQFDAGLDSGFRVFMPFIGHVCLTLTDEQFDYFLENEICDKAHADGVLEVESWRIKPALKTIDSICFDFRIHEASVHFSALQTKLLGNPGPIKFFRGFFIDRPIRSLKNEFIHLASDVLEYCKGQCIPISESDLLDRAMTGSEVMEIYGYQFSGFYLVK